MDEQISIWIREIQCMSSQERIVELLRLWIMYGNEDNVDSKDIMRKAQMLSSSERKDEILKFRQKN